MILVVFTGISFSFFTNYYEDSGPKENPRLHRKMHTSPPRRPVSLNKYVTERDETKQKKKTTRIIMMDEEISKSED